jgi:hypothetical protein
MFDVVPPGMQAMIKMPMAMGSGTTRNSAITKPRSGMIPYWLSTPMPSP